MSEPWDAEPGRYAEEEPIGGYIHYRGGTYGVSAQDVIDHNAMQECCPAEDVDEETCNILVRAGYKFLTR